MIVLGLNAYHGDASACIVRDGVLLAAAEEERFRRIKHWAGFPSEAVRYCLAEVRCSFLLCGACLLGSVGSVVQLFAYLVGPVAGLMRSHQKSNSEPRAVMSMIRAS